MKRIFFVLTLVISFSPVRAQDSTRTGCIQYEEIVQLSERQMRYRPGGSDTEFKRNWELCFTPERSFYTFQPAPKDEFEEQSIWSRMYRWDPVDIYRLDLVEKQYTHYTEFLSKAFRIEDTLSMEGWKMTGKQGVVQGYPCLEARRIEDDTVEVLAWFTPRIPVQTGPGEYCGLPGVVLYVNIGNGRRTISAVRIDMGATRDEEPEMPSRGERLTRTEFELIKRERSR